MWARLRGESADLVSYDEVCQHLPPDVIIRHNGVREIPLSAIVGSVGRYNDYTRDFLPLRDSDRERWARVRASLDEMRGWDPIDVYQLGDVYFVNDGNHRVSVARQMGVPTITARVTEVPVKVPISAEDDPEAIIAKARYADFLNRTNIDQILPSADLRLTFHTQYDILLNSIQAFALENSGQETTTSSVLHGWYEKVYLPTIEIIREHQTQGAFPDRTEADLFVLLLVHGKEVSEQLGWEVSAENVADDLVADETKRKQGWWSRLLPRDLDIEPATGTRRHERQLESSETLFTDILIGVEDSDADWQLLLNAIQVAQREQSRLLILYHRRGATASADNFAALKSRIEAECKRAAVEAEIAYGAGTFEDTVLARARWADLVITNLTGPFNDSPFHLLSGPERIIRLSARPLFVWPAGIESPLTNALLPYDGSPKADEALFVATYLANRWGLRLHVVTVETENTAAARLDKARTYLDQHNIKATYALMQPPIIESVLHVAHQHKCDMMIMGGFGYSPMRYLMLGSTVTDAIRHFRYPILICR